MREHPPGFAQSPTGRTDRDRLIDALRFGPMALYMADWTEPIRMRLSEQVADDLLLAGWRKDDPPGQQQHHIGMFRVNAISGECECECPRCYVDDECICPDCTYDHDHSRRANAEAGFDA